MVDLVSPGVAIREIDLTTTVRNEPTSIAGVAILAQKGPIDQVVTVSSEEELANIFGKPNTTNHQYWFSAASFLMYSSTLKVVRILTTGAVNACVSGSAILIKNNRHYEYGDGVTGPYNDGSANVGIVAARSAGTWGNDLKVEYCNNAAGYAETTKTTVAANAAANATSVTLTSAAGFNFGDIVYFQEADGQKYRVTNIAGAAITIVRYPTTTAVGLASDIASGANVDREWRYADQFDKAPGTSQFATDRGGVNDELHIIIVDEDSGITGVEGEILEKYDSVSKASDALTDNGNDNYYADVLYAQSNYVYWMDHPAGATNWGSGALGYYISQHPTNILSGMVVSSLVVLVVQLHSTAKVRDRLQTAYDYFKDADTEEVNLLIAGPADC